jgi:hypothetical protein
MGWIWIIGAILSIIFGNILIAIFLLLLGFVIGDFKNY